MCRSLRFADKFVLVGDHFQLPPLVRNRDARKGGHDVSLFRRLSDAHPHAVVDLAYQYRMSDDIMFLSNKLIYGDRLRCGSDETAKRSLVLPDRRFLRELHGGKSSSCYAEGCWQEKLMAESCRAIFVDTDRVPAHDSRIGDLVQNEVEATLVYQVAETLLHSGIRQDQIGIISLYRQQIKLLSHRLQHRKEVEILTADRSQGRDKDCVIILLVRSSDAGQIGDLVNVQHLELSAKIPRCEVKLDHLELPDMVNTLASRAEVQLERAPAPARGSTSANHPTSYFRVQQQYDTDLDIRCCHHHSRCWPSPVFAATAGSFADGGNTKINVLRNEQKVYILDKAEANLAQIKGHSAWGGVWDMNTHEVVLMDVKTNVFCASGMHLPNGSFVIFGGNGAVGPGGSPKAIFDETFQDFDSSKSIRVLNPCKSSDNFDSSNCQWFDDPSVLSMQRKRWYSAAEPLADGSVVLIGGFVNGGYVNRNFPNTDPEFEGGAADCTYEFFPSNNQPPKTMQFMIHTSGLNSYAHTFLMPSGKMFVQANVSTVMWDYNNNVETPLPDMPGGVARVYPASGAVAMLPLTPANNYVPTILFCGGSNMPANDYGDYKHPAINTWDYAASQDCQRITPEPTDGSAATYVKDDDMLERRTMGQFIILPNGKLMVVNGGLNGTAGYADSTGQTPTYGEMPFGMSLSTGPVGTPAIYDPNAPKGSRWSNGGLSASNIARLYHSSAILLPDASVLIAGSNPNVDVNISTIYPTQYQAEIFYPPYFAASTRPVPQGIPKTLSYGGDPFDITIPGSSYSANDAADNTTVVLVRPQLTSQTTLNGAISIPTPISHLTPPQNDPNECMPTRLTCHNSTINCVWPRHPTTTQLPSKPPP